MTTAAVRIIIHLALAIVDALCILQLPRLLKIDLLVALNRNQLLWVAVAAACGTYLSLVVNVKSKGPKTVRVIDEDGNATERGEMRCPPSCSTYNRPPWPLSWKPRKPRDSYYGCGSLEQ